jgi:hypothetical protein
MVFLTKTNQSYICGMMQTIRSVEPDLIVSPRGLAVHRAVLAKLSPVLAPILMSTKVIIFPDVEEITIKRFISLLYTGR